MSVTTVPIQPIKKGSLAKLWIGLALILAVAAALAWAGTSEAVINGASDEEFLAANADEDGVETKVSGLQIKVIQPGEGPSPTATDITQVTYTGSLRDGTVFDSSVGQPGDAAAFPVNGVVPGFSEALQLMQKGGEYRIWVPSDLAYGEVSPGPEVPANAMLIFDVSLLDFISQEQMQQLQQQMQQQGAGAPPGMPGGPPAGR